MAPARPATIAKLRAPRLVSAIPRARLFKRLDTDLRRGRIVWIAAPAGAGKTTLAAGYAAARHLKHLWFQFDARDADPATFFYYLREAVARLTPRARRVLPLLTPEYAFGLGTYARNFFEQLAALLKPPGLLIFDNYHELPEETPLHALLAEGLAALPETLGVLVLSRNDPPPAFAVLHVTRRLAVFDAGLLALSLPEVRALARRYHFKRLATGAIESLHRRTCGWTAGAILMLEEAARERATVPRFDRPMAHAMFDYFAAEVVRHLDEQTQDFLFRSALLPHFTAESATALTGNPQGGEIARSFARRNFFVTQRAGTPASFEYHPLFRAFLRQSLMDRLSPEDLIAVYGRAAQVLAEADHLAEAVDLMVESMRWAALAALLCRAAPALVLQGRGRALVAWIERLPAAMRESEPSVMYWLGMALLPYEPLRAYAAFRAAYHGFQRAGSHEFRWQAWCGIVDSIVFEWRDFHPLDAWIAEAERDLGSSEAAVPPALDPLVACGMFLALMNRCPEHPRMHYWAQRAWELGFAGADPNLRLKVGPHLLLYYTWWTGDLSRAQQLLNRLRPYAEDPKAPPLLQTAWCAMAGAYYWLVAEHAACIDIVEQGLAVGEATGVHAWDVFLCSHGMFATLTAGAVEPARRYAERMARLQHPDRTMDSSAYHYLLSYLSFSEGDRDQARVYMKAATELAEASGAAYQAELCRNELGRLLYDAGDTTRARVAVEQVLVAARNMRSLNLEYLCGLVQADAAFRQGMDEDGRAALARSLAIGRSQGFRNHPFWDNALMARLYARALELGIEVAYVQDMIRRRALAPPLSSAQLENWPWPIRLYTFGRFALVKDGQPVKFEGKAQKKTLELLKTLIALGGREVSEQRLCDNLWPEAEADDARANLKITLHRLRKIVGHEALILQDSKLQLDGGRCWVDAWAFERLVGRAMSNDRLLPAAELQRLGEQALALYRGPFLAADDALAMTTRERLRGKLIRAIAATAARLQHDGAHEPAIAWYERGIEIEPLAEPFYQGLMRVYQILHRPAEGLGVYQRCKKILAAQLQVATSPETDALARALRGDGS